MPVILPRPAFTLFHIFHDGTFFLLLRLPVAGFDLARNYRLVAVIFVATATPFDHGFLTPHASEATRSGAGASMYFQSLFPSPYLKHFPLGIHVDQHRTLLLFWREMIAACSCSPFSFAHVFRLPSNPWISLDRKSFTAT